VEFLPAFAARYDHDDLGMMTSTREAPLTATGSTDPFDRLPSDITGVTTRARLSELRERLWMVLEELDPKDRDVLVLRGIEQVANRDAAIVLGLEACDKLAALPK
jgi:DNA-directed RNA polymerase specialized sigma24 family protein